MTLTTLRPLLAAVVAYVGLLSITPGSARAFCGFYVAGGESSLFNDATQVVLMRKGQRTVLSMQNNYQGPPENFAMVIPVPVVLEQDNVKTLPPELFAKIDNLSAPRLVEYWEQDPCMPDYYDDDFATGNAAPEDAVDDGGTGGGGVVVEAEFEVGEYEIVILSTDDATALESWLTTNEYTIPEGASDAFDPYVQGGSYFFVAKVKADEVTFRDGNAVLSPLRFYYDTPTFSLPIKLGLINAQGSQDLIVYTLGEEQRYEVANRPNVTIPTNIEVINEVRDDFGTFYRTLFAETIAQNPGAAVTEYSWASSSCDPCPGPTLDQIDIATLGGDVVGETNEWSWRNWTLTRIHLRYDASTLGDDLVFAEAEPIFGGREVYNEDRELETGSGPGWTNNFQGRYIIRHRWDGPVECGSPVYGRWGGPDGSDFPGAPQSATSPNTEGAASSDSGTAGGGNLPSDDLEDLVYDNIPELDVVASNDPPASTAASSGCSCESADGSAFFLLIGGLYFLSRRRRRVMVK